MAVKIRSFILFIASFIICYSSVALHAQDEIAKINIATTREKISLESYLLPENHPLQDTLKEIFTDPQMFLSNEHFRRAGFKVKNGHRTLMVGFHPLTPNYLYKKFPDKMPTSMQLSNYVKRIKGSNIVRAQIKKRNCQHLVVPKKWIYELPKSFRTKENRRSFVLIVENMDIYDSETNLALYYDMDVEILTELITILHDIHECDSAPRNQPFTHFGKIAFVDTEHVGYKKGQFFKHTLPVLNENLQEYAKSLWRQLDENEEAVILPAAVQ